MNPTPKEFYRRHHKEESAQLAVLVNEPWFQRAVMAARAEIATRRVNTDFLMGAANFVDTLYSLAEEETKPLETHPPDPVLKTYG